MHAQGALAINRAAQFELSSLDVREEALGDQDFLVDEGAQGLLSLRLQLLLIWCEVVDNFFLHL